jgi:hypothetical protein
MSQEIHALHKNLGDGGTADTRVRLGDDPPDQLLDLDDLQRGEIELPLLVDRGNTAGGSGSKDSGRGPDELIPLLYPWWIYLPWT